MKMTKEQYDKLLAIFKSVEGYSDEYDVNTSIKKLVQVLLESAIVVEDV